MKVPFQLKISKDKSVTVEQAEVRHLRAVKKFDRGYDKKVVHEMGGSSHVSFYIKNSDNKGAGRIYVGIASCSFSDNYGNNSSKCIF